MARISKKTRPFKWLLLSFIVIAGIYPIVVLHYYTYSGKQQQQLGDDSLRPPWVAKTVTATTTTLSNNNNYDVHAGERLLANNVNPVNKHNASIIPSSSSSSSSSTNSTNLHKKSDVIVYLAQFSTHHSSYGNQLDSNQIPITGITKLNKSLTLLYSNYASQFPTDVLVFHDNLNPPSPQTMNELKRNRPNLQFRPLDEKKYWSLPYGLERWEHYTWMRPAFSIGYRLMMRWYAILIWFYLSEEGYSHVMRLDDDSYIHSKIDYNMFDYMRKNKIRYGFVQPTYEPGGDAFDALVDGYLNKYPNVTSQRSIESYKQDRGVGFYNNFFMADVSFFMSPPAATLLAAIDRSKLIFTQRTGDLVIQSAVVRLFLKPEEVHWFRDLTYEHMTLCGKEKCGYLIHKGCPQNGGVSRGNKFTNAEWMKFATEQVRNRFEHNPKKCSVPINQYFVGAEDVRTCSRLRSKCGFYLKMVSGTNDTVEDTAWLKEVYDGPKMVMVGKTL